MIVMFDNKIFLILWCCLSGLLGSAHNQPTHTNSIEHAIDNALQLTYHGDFRAAEMQYRNILSVYPTDIATLQYFGSFLLQQNKIQEGVMHLEQALLQPISSKFQSFLFLNYVEGLRLLGKLELAKSTAHRFLEVVRFHSPEDLATIHHHIGKIEYELGNTQAAADSYLRCLSTHLKYKDCWKRLCEALMEAGQFENAWKYAKEAVEHFPYESGIIHTYGLGFHHLKRVDEALKLYEYALELDPNNTYAKVSKAAALQGLGKSDEALSVYSELLQLIPRDAAMLNNLGALLGTMNRHDEEIYWLFRALEVNPLLEQALTNVAGFYQDEGLLDDAVNFLRQIPASSKQQQLLISLRIATMMSPISASWEQMVFERQHIEKAVKAITELTVDIKAELDNSFDRIHFYISFHGLNDKYIQESIGAAYRKVLVEADWIQQNLHMTSLHEYLVNESSRNINWLNREKKRMRIGFISKFFGIFEPHGMLLDGVMKYLPRHQFEVICLPVARSDGKPVASILSETCDEIVHISLIHHHALNVLSNMRLDVLLFADFVSEPINHFLAFSRIAPVQIGFWGNPITSGSPNIDFFISAEVMEHPFRTRMPPSDDPYSEQVLLTEGQGIWYFRPVDPEVELAKVNLTHRVGKPIPYSRASFNLSDEWFIFLLPQSVFKIHPLYDYVLAEILHQNPSVHLVVTGGRRLLWTNLYRTRLQHILGDDVYSHRLHIIERVSSENFYNFLSLADVILHPFPFDGSRTSADALMVHKPFITLPTEYLRGRMGYSFLRTMNIPELVAIDITQYIQIAGRLVNEPKFYEETVNKIKDRLDWIWEDMMFPYAISAFLQRLSGYPVSTYEEFLIGTKDRNVEEELERSMIRTANAAAFDKSFGQQLWQLDDSGRATLEAMIRDSNQWPRLFEHWRKTDLIPRNHSLPQHPPFVKFRNSKMRGFDLRQYVTDAVELKNLKRDQRVKNLKS